MTETTLLQTIDSPADLRKLPVEKLSDVAREIRSYIIECVSHTGGHLSSSLGSVELALALHLSLTRPMTGLFGTSVTRLMPIRF